MKLSSLEEMIKAALEEEQALDNLKPKFGKTNTTTFSKPKCYNCEGYGNLSRDCKKLGAILTIVLRMNRQ